MAQKLLKIAYDPVFAHPLPEGHRFPMLKYELIPQQLIYEGTCTKENFFSPAPCKEEIILLTHSNEYLQKLKSGQLTAQEQRRTGFPLTDELLHREFVITQGTIDCCHYAFENGVSLNVAGGTHHAYADRGEGFCLFNDFAVAANYLLEQKRASNILIIDLDVHQGNGTAKIFSKEKRVFTFSMHGGNNYPFHKEESDIDVPLPDGITDSLYLEILKNNLNQILKQDFDHAFYLSGVDILATDKFGKLKLTMEGCRKRDEMVFNHLKSAKIPCVVAMGGGYSPDIKTIVEAHCNTFRVAKELYELI